MSGNSTSQHDKSMLDPDWMNRLAVSVGKENVPAVLELILETTPQLRDELRAACTEGDMQRVARVAHKLKSNCAYLGTAELTSALAELETLAAEKCAVGCETAASTIQVQLEQFLQDVRREQQRRTG